MSSATLTMRAPDEEIVITPRGRGYSVRRYYDPAEGQFISVDPAVDQTEAPYAYVNGDPVNGIDPFGLGCGITSPGDCLDAAANAFLGGTTAIGNAIANSSVAQPFLSATTDIGNALGGAYYDFASAHPCIALSISITTQVAGFLVAPEEVGAEELGGGFELFHGTDVSSATDIIANGIDRAAAREAGGGDVFWATANRSHAELFAAANPAGGEPAIVGITLRGGISKAVADGIVSPVPGVPGAYAVTDWEAFNAIAKYGRAG